MKDNNRLTEKVMIEIAENVIEGKLKPLREIIDDALEKAWHEGYDSGQEDADEQQIMLQFPKSSLNRQEFEKVKP